MYRFLGLPVRYIYLLILAKDFRQITENSAFDKPHTLVVKDVWMCHKFVCKQSAKHSFTFAEPGVTVALRASHYHLFNFLNCGCASRVLVMCNLTRLEVAIPVMIMHHHLRSKEGFFVSTDEFDKPPFYISNLFPGQTTYVSSISILTQITEDGSLPQFFGMPNILQVSPMKVPSTF